MKIKLIVKFDKLMYVRHNIVINNYLPFVKKSFLNKNNGNKEEALKDLRFSVAHIFNHVS